jgi:hypothetical protein
MACGGSSQPAASSGDGTATASTSGDDASSSGSHGRRTRRRRHTDDASASADDTSDTGAGSGELPLDPRADVPGTGVTLRAPRGSEPAPVGAGFIHARRRIQIVVAVAQGDDQVLEGVQASLAAGAEEVEHEDITVQGRAARLIVDRQETPDVELERVWLLAREGHRVMAIIGAYVADRSERLRPLVRASLLSAEWDPASTLDPEAAAGYRLTPPEGLAAEPQVVSTLSYTEPGQTASPQSGHPALLVVPVPLALPAERRTSLCHQILTQAGPVSEDTMVRQASIEGDDVSGCEVYGTQELTVSGEGGLTEIATYAALVFVGDASFMVAGFSDARQRETWEPRFSAAARTVAAVPR